MLFLTHIDLSHWIEWSGSVGFSHASSSSQTWSGGGGRINSGRKWPVNESSIWPLLSGSWHLYTSVPISHLMKNTFLIRITWENSDFKTRSRNDVGNQSFIRNTDKKMKHWYYYAREQIYVFVEGGDENITAIWQLLIQACLPPDSKRTQPILLVKVFWWEKWNTIRSHSSYSELSLYSETTMTCTSFIFASYTLKWQIAWRWNGRKEKSMADFGHSQVNLETFINPWIHKCHIHFHKTVKVQQENEVTELFHKTRLIPKL